MAKKKAPRKPKLPRRDFPLWPHLSGQWAKKVRQKVWYFGAWDDPIAAEKRWDEEKEYLLKGEIPPTRQSTHSATSPHGATLKEVCNAFMASKEAKLQSGELATTSYRDYFKTCKLLLDIVGADRIADTLTEEDFANVRKRLTKKWGLITVRNELNRMRGVFKFAHKKRLMKQAPDFGDSFDRPSSDKLRKAIRPGKRDYTAAEIQAILGACSPQMKAMVLLGINCGFGNSDCARLTLDAIDWETGWIDFPRGKTGTARRCPLWPETLDALKAVIEERPRPKRKTDARLVFLTRCGAPWVRDSEAKDVAKGCKLDAISSEFRKIKAELGITGPRSFYGLRHTCQTQGDEARDPVAVKLVMGHLDPSMSGNYRHGVSDDRLRNVSQTIHDWLFGKEV